MWHCFCSAGSCHPWKLTMPTYSGTCLKYKINAAELKNLIQEVLPPLDFEPTQIDHNMH